MVELLAPAGDYEGMEGAIAAGADAVYAGGAAFGARAYARNFDREEMLDAIDYVHLRGKKLYLTVNTLLKNIEIKRDLYAYLAPYYERGLDAVIVQDLGVLQFVREQFPGLSIHASTQMTVTGPKGMQFLEQKGVTRVVTARELSLEEIRQMHQSSSLEIEAFVHGALCYCYSGQCLFSSILGGRSGNRGRCAQPCRLPYEYAADGIHFRGGSDLHPLSPKDMCALELLPEIIDAGVYSLKIEGRMKQPGYTAGVVGIYRKYLDNYEKDPAHYQVNPQDRNALLELFSRGGSHEGYFHQKNGPSMIAFHSEKKIGNAYPEIARKKIKVNGQLTVLPGQPVALKLVCGSTEVCLEAGMAQEARNQPMTRERIAQQINKTGETPFEFQELQIHMGETVFVPVKILNELRREGFQKLSQELCRPERRKRIEPISWPDIAEVSYQTAGDKISSHKEDIVSEKEDPETNTLPLSAFCETKEQLEVCLEQREITRIYLPLELACQCMDPLLDERTAFQEQAYREFFLALPHVVRFRQLESYRGKIAKWIGKGLNGFLVRNLEGYAWLKDAGYGSLCRLDTSLYTWNDWSRKFWSEEKIAGDTIPLELNQKELGKRENSGSELLVYGYLPLMISAQCVQKNMETCRKNRGIVWLKDRYQKKFPVKCYCDFCYNVIYNSLPYGLSKEVQEVQRLHPESIRLSFAIESRRETQKILQAFVGVYVYHRQAKDYSFTKGHWKRGVE